MMDEQTPVQPEPTKVELYPEPPSKRKRGRPRLSKVEKDRRKEIKAFPPNPVLRQPQLAPPTQEEWAEIQRLQDIMAKAEATRRLQSTPPKEVKEQRGNVEVIHVAPAKEFTIEDEPKGKPAFIQADEEGWQPIS